MQFFSGYSIKGKSRGVLRHWSCLFEEWFLVIDRYCRITKDDTPYWYNERANIGILAGAAWRCGWIALEEFQSEKTDMIPPEEGLSAEKVKWMGRADLYLASEYHHDYIEAKFKWVNLSSEKMILQISECLDKACVDAKNSKGENYSNDIGICFIPFYVKATKQEQMDELITSAISRFGEVDTDACAWIFPQTVRTLAHETTTNIRPGVALFARKIRST